MQKLIKLSDTHYIVVDDSEIKVDDYYIDDTNTIRRSVTSDKDYWGSRVDYRKITHSTQPELLGTGWMQSVLPLFLSEVEELINGYSVEKMADEWSIDTNNVHPADSYIAKSGYEAGFKAHQELVKDKLFNELENKLTVAKEYWSKFEGEKQQGINYGIGLALEFLKIQSKIEWEVEFDEQGKIKLV